MPETTVYDASKSYDNSKLSLIPENVKANPHMFHGWREGLLWALINPRLLEQFRIETGSGITDECRGIGAFISPECGLQVSELAIFVDWYNCRIWRGRE